MGRAWARGTVNSKHGSAQVGMIRLLDNYKRTNYRRLAKRCCTDKLIGNRGYPEVMTSANDGEKKG